jgi:triosephosphate isomerase
MVNDKIKAVFKHDMTPIVCVGETLEERQAGTTEAKVTGQIQAAFAGVPRAQVARSVVAYEPVWAIGTGHNATPAQAQKVHEFLRARVAQHGGGLAGNLQILYGGSVKAGNAAELFAMPDVDGGLVGGASLVADDFVAICRAADIAG